MSFRFERRRVDGPLARWVDAIWFARGRIAHAREHIAPTGASVAVLTLGEPIAHATRGDRATRLVAGDGWICGPHDRPSLNEPTGETHCYGVVSTPVGCATLFGLDPERIRGRVVPLEAWKAGPALRRALIGLEPERGLEALRDGLAGGLEPEPPRAARVERAVDGLVADPTLSVAALAQRLDVSHAYLDREFRRIVGLGPRRLAAIVRVRRLLGALDVFAEPDWSALSADHGWYDQSHMIRDFRRYTGVTPGAYVAAQRAHFQPAEAGQASGFVPLGAEVKSVQDAGAAPAQAGREEVRP